MKNKKLSILWSVMALSILFSGTSISAEIIHVDACAFGSETGESWTDAFTSLHTALNSAVPGDQIWVVEGVYYATSSFMLSSGVEVYGGFAGTETLLTERDWQENKTILSGDLGQDDVNDDGNWITESWDQQVGTNADHVVVAPDGVDNTARLDGFIVTAGSGISYYGGGGILNWNSSPSYYNLEIRGNQGHTYGGGMLNASSSPHVENVLIDGNRLTNNLPICYGGGMYNLYGGSPVIINVQFNNNLASAGGGYAGEDVNAFFDDVVFSNNISTGVGGGGVYLRDQSNAILNHVTFRYNQAFSGGGLYHVGGGTLTLRSVAFLENTVISSETINSGGGLEAAYGVTVDAVNVSVIGNTATDNGGGVSFTDSSIGTFTNCLFIGNRSVGGTIGGVRACWGSTVTLTNTTFNGNRASGTGGAFGTDWGANSISATNCIIWGNYPDQVLGSGISISYSNVQMDSGVYTGTGNINCNPLFIEAVDPLEAPTTGGDLRINGISPCVDTGENTYNSEALDFRGQARIQNSTIDMGAYEWTDGIDPSFQVIYVNAMADGNNDGSSWTDAFISLQSGLDAAISGNHIWVAKGTYVPEDSYDLFNTPRNYHFRMIEGVEIYGGFSGTETSSNQRTHYGVGEENETILSGDLNGDDVVSGTGETLAFSNYTDNCYHVIYNPDPLTSTSLLNGFSVRGGNADGTNPHNSGSGIYNFHASPSLTNVILIENQGIYGGGIYNQDASPVVTNCIIYRNLAQNGAGSENETSSPVFINTTIVMNLATNAGGGLNNHLNATPTFNNCIIWGNHALTGNQMYISGGGTTILNYSCYPSQDNDVIMSGATFVADNNNTTENPDFLDAIIGDFRLLENSPAVNRGLNSYNTTLTDVRGQARIQNTTIDMGAYEWTPGVDPYSIAGILYVDINAVGANNGASWADAFTSLQSALDIAIPGDQIWVAKGTYIPSSSYNLTNTPRYYHFRMMEGVEIYGGFAGTETSMDERTNFGMGDENETILSGDRFGDDIVSGSGETLTFSNNSENCYHVIYNPDPLTTASVLNGFTVKGGHGNGTEPFDRGSGVFNSGASPSITNVSITANVGDYGGGVCNYNASPIITNCLIYGNKTTNNSAGIENSTSSSPVLTNTTIAMNVTTNYGGGMLNYNNCSPVLQNCIVWGNLATTGNQMFLMGGGTTTLKYSCYANGTNDVVLSGGSDILDATINNISVDPLFVSAETGDLRIDGSSSCVDTGDNNYNNESCDIRGQDRIQNTTIDMGAYEWTVGVDPPLQVIFVDLLAGGNNDGSCWVDAYTSLQSALNEAVSGNQIWVAKGTYKPEYDYGLGGGSRYYHFRMVEGTEIYGGFAGTETGVDQRTNYGFEEANETILSGDLNDNDDFDVTNGGYQGASGDDNCYHVFYHPDGMNLTNSALLDGFTITGGNANRGSNPHNRGGAFYLFSSSPVIRKVNFDSNKAESIGGAVYMYDSMSFLENASFSNNLSSNSGGGVYVYNGSPEFDGLSFASNYAYNAGAIYFRETTASIRNAIFTGNNSVTDGGALSTHSSSLTIANALFSSNTTTNNGGAIIFYSSSVQYDAVLNNVTISENHAGLSGGGIRFASDNVASTLTIRNSVIWNNTATSSGNELSLVSTGSTTINYSCYKNLVNDVETLNGILDATNNNITIDPLFIDAFTQDFRLLGCSPAVNSGLNSYNTASTDVRGQARIQNTTIDMGAYEWTHDVDPYSIAGILYADINAVGANNGASWADAFTSLQSALDIAIPGDQIWVAKGTYIPSSSYNLTNTPRYYHFRMMEGVEIYGGFAGTETSMDERTNFGMGDENETILSGDRFGDDIVSGSGETLTFSNNSENCYHVIYNPDPLTTASVLNGFTVKGGHGNGTEPFDRGSGVFNSGASPSITNVSITANVGDYGGGVCNYNASPIITNCLIYGNKTTNNSAGIENSTSSSPVLTNTTIAMNVTTNYGGGMLNYNNCSPVLQNCIVWGNLATTGNQMFLMGGGTTTLKYSCYANGTNDVVLSGGSDILDATINNISVDPLFVSAETGDLRIDGSSSCVDTGDNNYNNESCDIRGQDRIQNTTIDMGAYEWTVGVDPGELTAPANVTISVGDSSILLSWTIVPDATSYIIYRSEFPDREFVQIGTTATESYIDTEPLRESSCFYFVVAANNLRNDQQSVNNRYHPGRDKKLMTH